MAVGRIAIGVDVGGSGIKAAVVDVEAGRFRSERIRVATPQPSTPDAVVASVGRVVKRLVKSGQWPERDHTGRRRPAGRHDGRHGHDREQHRREVGRLTRWSDRLVKATGRTVTIVNDADAAGIAEMRFGQGRDKRGMVVVLTLGTGVGSGVFIDGRLVPNVGIRHDGDPRQAGRVALGLRGTGPTRDWAGRRGRSTSMSTSNASTTSCGRR